ncbi:putative N-ethylmaleimide reductase [Thozetella sp. PMI_491]|nr:putative N-ethylmaleimide reductase [Thozetella sp. PMI_491]
MTANNKLFTPFQIGSIPLGHRVVMAPMTRYRATADHIPNEAMMRYYAQRAVVPGTLLVTEATFVSARGGGYANIPGLWNDEQLAGWKKVTDAVHAKKGKIFVQLWFLGRAAWPDPIHSGGAIMDNNFDFAHDYVAPSSVKMFEEQPPAREMTEQEIWTAISEHAIAAKNAVEKAGFDGVEIHGANGFLIDQFIQDVTNVRTDQWGGSIENRARFPLEIAKAVVKAVGADRVGIRFSPWSTWQGMGMADPIPQYTYLIERLRELDLAYLHLIEPRVHGIDDMEVKHESLDFCMRAWGREKPVIVSGGFTGPQARDAVENQYRDYNVAVSFGRAFISTPDLVYRIQKALSPNNNYDRTTFYIDQSKGEKVEPGYITYPYSDEFLREFGKPDVAF